MVHAQNTRNCWNWLTNPNLSKDEIKFGYIKANENIIAETTKDLKNLRLIRTRTQEIWETPQQFATNPIEDTQSFSGGLFEFSERSFYSLATRPDSRNKLNPKTKKSEYPMIQAWNASAVEFTVAFKQPNDDARDWALLAHKLRDVSINFRDETKLPLPLHLAKLTEEYIVNFESEYE
jgi:RNaseH domain of pPIWI_RE